MTSMAMCAVTALLVLSGVAVAQAADPPAKPDAGKKPSVVLKTSMGEFTVELASDKAPITVKNFLEYVEAKHYDGTIFHRVIPAFMIQGGGFTPEMQQKPTRAPIKNEAGNGLKNVTGAIAMARTSAPDSATAQFFVNAKDNPFLDHRDETPAGFGYAVFGRVTAGMDVVKQIEGVQTTSKPPHQNVPATPVVIESVRVVP